MVDLTNREYDSIYSTSQSFKLDCVQGLGRQRKEDMMTRSRSVRFTRWPDWSIDVEKRKKMKLVAIFS